MPYSVIHIKSSEIKSSRLLWNGQHSKIYENTLDKNSQTIIKLFNLSATMNDQIYAEHNSLSSLSLNGVRGVKEKIRIGDQLGLVLEKIPGRSLKEFIKNHKLNLLDFLELSINLSEIIKDIHQSGWLHLNINAYNIIITDNLKVKVIGFSKATKTPSKVIHSDTDILPYCAPEQTGRINRLTDERTDCYSLGIVLYELLQGNVPFNYSDKSKLIHAILTECAASLIKEDFNIPVVIDQIVNNLINKDPDKRYQNVQALHEDLSLCLHQLKHHGNIKPLKRPLLKHKIRFRLSQKLYGRQVELEKLLNSYERVFYGETEIVLISSLPGMGKTSLVFEIQNHVAHRNGTFVSGKFDQFQQNIPNLAISEALKNLINRLLLEDELKLIDWKRKILSAVGVYGKLIIDLAPNLEKIIGKQPEIKEVDSLEAQNRFNFVFKEFIKIFTSVESPLIIFLDDIQWSDTASMELIKWLLNNRDISSLMIVFAYRQDEISISHPVKSFIGDLQSSKIASQEMELKNLHLDDIHSLLKDSFGSDLKNFDLLSTHIHQITKGNPFFIKQMLVALKDNELMNFDYKEKKWVYEKNGVFNLCATEDVIDLLIHKINKLDSLTKEILCLAACVGNRFEIEDLSKISNNDHFGTIDLLKPIAEQGLIERQNGYYVFSHDKIQQAAYAMVDEKTKPQIHFDIGKILLKKYPIDTESRKLFDIAYHVNNGRQLINNKDFKEEVISINYKAALKAKQSNAFDPGLHYLEQAIGLMGSAPWKGNYDLTIKIFQEAADITFLKSDFELSDYYVQEIFKNAKILVDKIPAYEVKIMSLRARSRLVEAVELVEEVSGILYIKFPSNPGYHHILIELIKSYFLMKGKEREFFLKMPDMTDQNMTSVMRILTRHDSTTYIVNPKLTPLILLKQLEISIKYGITPVFPSALLGFGAILIAGLGKVEKGYYYGNMALDLVRLPRSKNFRSRVIYGVMTLIYPWKHHLNDTIDPLNSAYHYGLEDGDQEHASYSMLVKFMHQLFSGTQLNILKDEIDKGLEVITPLKQEIPLNMIRIIRQYIYNHTCDSPYFIKLDGNWFREYDDVPKMDKSNDSLGISLYYLLKGFLCMQDSRPEEAVKFSDEILPNWDSIKATYSGSLYKFQSGLIAASIEMSNQKRILRKLRKSINYLKKLSKTCPDNNLHKYQLLLAEKYRLKGKHAKAREHYDMAISSARKSQFLHEEALCYELAGKYYHSNNNEILKEVYLQKAYDAYLKWGSIAKSHILLKDFPSSIVKQREKYLNIDVDSLVKTASIISEEVNTKPLIRKLLPIVIQSAGAQKGVLVMISNNQLLVKASLSDKGEVIMYDSLPLSESDFISQEIVKHVARNGKSLLLENVLTDDNFNSESYVLENKLISVSCIPLMSLSKVIAILYLENNLIPGAFEPENIELLKTLSGHMAISLSNAEIHENLEAEVLSRTNELEKEKMKSDELLLNILPESTARELKKNGSVEPLVHENVSVLFTDIQGFTALSESLTANELVNELDYCFKNFDRIIGEHGLEKIKTIGDAYMCAGGVPIYRERIELDVIRSAIDILNFMENLKKERINDSRPYFEIRVGIHTGTVIAGIVGIKKFTYDIWGDTVNIASRIESHGEVGRLNISESTYEKIKDNFKCEFRGKIEVKNKGKMPIYRVVNEIVIENNSQLKI